MMDSIELKGITKVYGSVEALSEVSLKFEQGKFYCVSGPNGAGKTTLFRIISGLVDPSEGRVLVPDLEIGCSYQDPKFYGNLSVEENLSVFKEMVGRRGEWVEKVIGSFELDDVYSRKASDLSAGNAKKLDLALSLIKKPDFLLLDEPFSSLDEEARKSLECLFKSNVLGAIIVFSHRLAHFFSLSDEIIVLQRGEVVFEGSREEAREEGFESLEVLPV